jgi:hypothetical protein
MSFITKFAEFKKKESVNAEQFYSFLVEINEMKDFWWLTFNHFSILRQLHQKAQSFSEAKISTMLYLIRVKVGMPNEFCFLSDQQVKELIDKVENEVEDEIEDKTLEKEVEEMMNNTVKTLKYSDLHDFISSLHNKVMMLEHPEKVTLKERKGWMMNDGCSRIPGWVFSASSPVLPLLVNIRKKLGLENIKEVKVEKGPCQPDMHEKKEIRTANDNKPFLLYTFLRDENGDEVKDGEYTEYWPGSDVIRFQGTMKKGMLDGTWIRKNKEGIITKIENFKEDKFHGDRLQYNDDGTLSSISQYKLGVPHGIHREFTDPPIQVCFVDGKKKVVDDVHILV